MISPTILTAAVQGKKVLIDSNIIIYLTDEVQPYAPIAQTLFQLIENGDASAVISILSIGEVMQGPLRRNLRRIAVELKDYLFHFPNISCQSVTTDVLNLLGRNESIAWSRLRIVDSLIIASGLLHGVDLFLSNDAHFKTALPREMVLAFE